jgi:hypothetical protein
MEKPLPAEIPRPLEPAPPLAVRVLEFFRDHLAEIEFPDVSTSILESQIAELDERRVAVETARAQLRQVESTLDTTRTALAHLAERALAYARIYADGDPGLVQALAALESVKPPRTKPKARTSRKNGKATSPPAQTTLPSPEVTTESSRHDVGQGTAISNEMA